MTSNLSSKSLSKNDPSPRRASRTRRWLVRVGLAVPTLLAAVVCLAALGNGRVDAPVDYRASALLSTPAGPLPAPVTLRVVTWNIANAYGFTNNRRERVTAIARMLRELDPDLVGLQEAFVAADREILWRELEGSRLAHQVRFPAATVGNGLWILSAHPIREAWFHRFAHSNPWYRLFEGDWWAGKGIGLARVDLPGGGSVDFYDTHAQAGRDNPDNERVRLGQMQELAEFVASSRRPGAAGFIVGDFNTTPDAPDYRLAVERTPLQRAMTLPSRIDHVFALPAPGLRYETKGTRVLAGRIPVPRPGLFLSRAPGLLEWIDMRFGPPGESSLSDHPGYLSEIRIAPGS